MSIHTFSNRQCSDKLFLSAITSLELEMGDLALEHGFTVVTRNVRDFADMGVALVNPWRA